MRTTWSRFSLRSPVQNTSEQQKRNTIGSTESREMQSADDEHDLENLRRLGALLPQTHIADLEGPGPAGIDCEAENLMPRRTGHRAVERKRRLANLLDEPTIH